MSTRKRLVIGVIVIFFILLATSSCSSNDAEVNNSSDSTYTEYQCDAKIISLATKIEIKKENEEFATVKGNIFTFVTDPLTMYDPDDNKVAYAGDAYHFIAQDSHTIYVDNTGVLEMVGLVDIVGESYDLYDMNSQKVAEVSFNIWDTNGKMYDMDGRLIAEYTSNPLFWDFNVKIYKECEFDERAVLMIFCSYYSDKEYDASNN